MRIFALTVATLLLIACDVNLDSKYQVSKAYIKSVYNGDLAELRRYVEVSKLDISEDVLLFSRGKATAKKESRDFREGLKNIRFINEEVIDKYHATLFYEVSFGNDEKRKLRIKLYYKDARWFINPSGGWFKW